MWIESKSYWSLGSFVFDSKSLTFNLRHFSYWSQIGKKESFLGLKCTRLSEILMGGISGSPEIADKSRDPGDTWCDWIPPGLGASRQLPAPNIMLHSGHVLSFGLCFSSRPSPDLIGKPTLAVKKKYITFIFFSVPSLWADLNTLETMASIGI